MVRDDHQNGESEQSIVSRRDYLRLSAAGAVGAGTLSSMGEYVGEAKAAATTESLPHEKPLQGYARNIGGSAGKGTHGGQAVKRPSGMPTKAEADYVVSTPDELVNAVTTDEAIVYIDKTITLKGPQNIELGDNVTLVGGFCDPTIPGRGPVIEQDYYHRKLFISNYQRPPTLWGISLRGPNSDLEYFDPRDEEYSGGDLTPEDWYAGGIHCYDDKEKGTFRAIGCEFWAWTVAGIELGAKDHQTDADVIRCTFHSNIMETLGYGIEQYNGHLWCDRSFYDRCRHGISGYGYTTESWELTESVIGPNDWAGHAMDMHDRVEPNRGGHHISVRDCTFMITEDIAGYGQEGIAQRGVSVAGDEIWGCDFWHPTKPVPPGDQGDAYRQETPEQRDSFENFNPHDNAFGGPNKGFGAPRAGK
jgi:hypothetical protein